MAIANPHRHRPGTGSGGGRDRDIVADRLIVVFPHATSPTAVAVKPVGACAACGLDFADRSVALFHPLDGILCHDCYECARGGFERCTDCGALTQLGPTGETLIAGGGRLHFCPVVKHDIYALASYLRDRR